MKPKPGDVIKYLNPGGCLIEPDGLGIIGGNVKKHTCGSICFNFITPYMDEDSCMVSGGPALFYNWMKEYGSFKYIKKIHMTFWNWNGHLPGADMGVKYQKEVRLFEFKRTKP